MKTFFCILSENLLFISPPPLKKVIRILDYFCKASGELAQISFGRKIGRLQCVLFKKEMFRMTQMYDNLSL